MPNARNILNVTFDEAIEKIRSIRRARMFVGFTYKHCDDEKIIVRSIRVSKLYKDWYGDCNICPSNDTYISNLHIHLDDSYTTINIANSVMFEQLMDKIEEVTIGHECN